MPNKPMKKRLLRPVPAKPHEASVFFDAHLAVRGGEYYANWRKNLEDKSFTTLIVSITGDENAVSIRSPDGNPIPTADILSHAKIAYDIAVENKLRADEEELELRFREAFDENLNSLDVVQISKKGIRLLSGVYCDHQRNILMDVGLYVWRVRDREGWTEDKSIHLADHEWSVCKIQGNFYHLCVTPLRKALADCGDKDE